MKRLILFDIDGTLLSTNGAARRAFERALLRVYGTAGPIATHQFDGKTDPQIARELLTLAGLAQSDIDAELPRLYHAYLTEMAAEVARPEHSTSVYPGVRESLAALHERADVLLGLLTGNIAEGASLKLRSVGLDHYFALGAYGSDSEQRSDLPAIAVQRAFEKTGIGFQGKDVVVIGDTPSDVSCGRSLGVFALAVCTGRHSRETLLGEGADLVLDDLSDTAHVLDILTGGRV
jgi:phosphoglycolate phosphatase-like HAD superfamily hydrolase